MTTGFRNSSGTDFDNVFDPYVQGTKPGTTGYRTSDGVDLNQRFAPLVFGTAAAATGFRLSSGADVNTLWAAKGTAQYSLGFNGGSYASNNVRATASLTLNMKSDGTWSVVRQQGISGETLLDSGTWLPSGGNVSDYTVKFVMTGFTSGPDEGGGSDDFSNGAPTPASLTTTRSAAASAVAVTIGNDATNQGTVTAFLYKTGVLISTSTCTFTCTSVGS